MQIGVFTFRTTNYRPLTGLMMLGLVLSLALTPLGAAGPAAPMLDVIVQAQDMPTAAGLVQQVGGTVTHELGIINAVGAQMSSNQLITLRNQGVAARIYANRQVFVAADPEDPRAASVVVTPDTAYPRLVDALALWAQGITGQGVTIAVVDTGAQVNLTGLNKDTANNERILAFYNAITNKMVRWNDNSVPLDVDEHGHGSHVAGTAAGSDVTIYGQYAGVAPDANLVIAKALDANGGGSYADVIRAID
jgi:subtilisin family serine protease